MKKMKSLFLLPLLVFALASCTEEDLQDQTLQGVWVRYPGPSGHRTDIAIGGIKNEPENRVYVCEKTGSPVAGFYKGTLEGNVIVWDDPSYPKAYLKRIGEELEFDYRLSSHLPTMYGKGTWGDECGPLEKIERPVAVGIDPNAWPTINYISIDDHYVPLTVLNEVTTEPDCSSPNSHLILGSPTSVHPYTGYKAYEVKVTYSYEDINFNYHTKTDVSYIYPEHFLEECNKFIAGYNGTAIIGLNPIE